jgi:endonuclease III
MASDGMPNTQVGDDVPDVSGVVGNTGPEAPTRYNLRSRRPAHHTSLTQPSPSTPKRSRHVDEDDQNPATPDSEDPQTPVKKRQRRSGKTSVASEQQELDGEQSTPPQQSSAIPTPTATPSPKPKRTPRKTKDNPYGLIAGETPYPNWVNPSPQQCQQVYDILASVHDDINPTPPKEIPVPSLEIAGCGEVPSVLDGLIRTVLSGSTTFAKSDMMLQALVRKFGILEEGVGKGSVNWNNVRTATYDEVYQQLKNGGLGSNKTKHIQSILQMVYEENMARRSAFMEEKNSGIQSNVTGAATETEGQKNLEILRADQEMLSLDYMHNMETYEALKHFVRYPGVGIKTAACVTLFSLQRPCFAVDTHVFRMSKWLGWVPQKTDEDKTFGHLDVRCPDQLKYGLHQLFIQHGKKCYRCNDMSFKGTEAWDSAVCPLEELLDRFSKRTVKPKEATPRKEKDKGKAEKGQENQDLPDSEVDDGAVDKGTGTDQMAGEEDEEVKAEDALAEDEKPKDIEVKDEKTEDVKAEDEKTKDVKAEDEKTKDVKAEDEKAEDEKAEDEKYEKIKAEDE